MSTDTEIQGVLYDGQSPAGHAATLWLRGPILRLTSAQEDAASGDAAASEYERASVRVSPRVASADRFLSLPDGRQLQCADGPALDTLPQEEPSEGFVSWLEGRSWVALLSVVATLVGGWALYSYLIPELAERAAAGISVEQERALGEDMLVRLDLLAFDESELESERQERIRQRFQSLTADLRTANAYRLEFRNAPTIGANAFALPGGIVVVTDELFEVCESDDRALAVLAHEAGHIERRHVLRQFFQDSANAVLALTLTGDATALSFSVAALPLAFAQAQHSREFESEADAFAWQLLAAHELSPELFAEALERLTEKTGNREPEWDFAATHPITTDRIARARAAAHGRGALRTGPQSK